MADYIATDQSVHDGAPTHLIKMVYQDTTHRWTTGDEVFTDGSFDEWEPNEIQPLKDLNIADNLEKTPIDLVCTLENPVAQLFRTNAIEASISVFIYEVHIDDGDIQLIHSGRILARHVKIRGKKREAILKCEPLITSIKRPAIREKMGKSCPYVLYDEATCKATRIAHNGTVATINGTALIITGADAAPSGDLTSGYLETASEKRMITSHTGTSVSVASAMQGLEVGDAVTLYIGCAHNTTDCESLHDNINNYGGEPFIPTKNPHIGRMV